VADSPAGTADSLAGNADSPAGNADSPAGNADSPAGTDAVEDDAVADSVAERATGATDEMPGNSDDNTDPIDDVIAAPADSGSLTWPPVRPVVETPPVTRTEAESGLHTPIKVTLDPFDPCRDRGELAEL
jgi:hypothetical protein